MLNSNIDIEWMAATDFMPHHFPMQMVESIALQKKGSALGKTIVQAHWPCIMHGPSGTVMPMEACAELIAQCYAGIAGLRVHMASMDIDKKEGTTSSSSVGFLVGLRNFKFEPEQIEIGTELFIQLLAENPVGPFTIIEGQVFRNKEIIASGQVKIYVPESGAK